MPQLRRDAVQQTARSEPQRVPEVRAPLQARRPGAQEGTIALMQLAKTVAAIARLDAASIPFISVLTDPTTGGVLASFASLGDIVLAEPGALIGFSGARVTSETIGEKLPKGFQRSEFLLEHGFVDQVVPRTQLKERIAFFLNSFRIAGQDLRWSL